MSKNGVNSSLVIAMLVSFLVSTIILTHFVFLAHTVMIGSCNVSPISFLLEQFDCACIFYTNSSHFYGINHLVGIPILLKMLTFWL